MRNKKVILSSILSLVLCLSLIVGGTFALFTSESETNIAINSGKVEVVATIENLAVHSPTAIAEDGTITDDTNAAVDGVFANGGTAAIEGSTLTLTNMTPGDKVTFDIRIENNSTVAVKYRTLLAVSENNGLFSGLNVTVDGTPFGNTLQSAWASLAVGSDDIIVPVEVVLPSTAGNEYQEKSTKLNFTVSAVQGNTETVDIDPDVDMLLAEGAATVNIPAGTLTAGEIVKLKVASAEAPSTVLTVDNTLIAATDISFIDADGNPVDMPEANYTVTMDIGKDLVDASKLAIYHNDQKVEAISYNAGTGLVTFTTNSFSPFTAVYEGIGYIDTVEELIAVRDSVNGGDTKAGVEYYLENDFDLTDVEWTAINNFAGTFDGQNYTISNLKDANLFSTISGEVKNLNLKSVTATKAGGSFSALAGTVSGKVTNCTVSDVEVAYTAYSNAMGGAGFIGTVASGAVVDGCKVSNATLSREGTGDGSDGGSVVIGSVQNGATVQNCEFSNIQYITNLRGKRVAGIFGSISGKVTGCTVNGVSIIAQDNYSGKAYIDSGVGCFAGGVNNGAEVTNCTLNDVSIIADEAFNTGGIFGKAYGGAKLDGITVNGLTMAVGSIVQTNWSTMQNVAGFIAQVDHRANEPRLIINNCHINDLDMTLASIEVQEAPSAGFIASLCGGTDITNCSVDGEINAVNEPLGVGGFIGDAGLYAGIEINITDCVADVAIIGNDSIFAGGFVAYAGSYYRDHALTLNFTNCEAKGSFYGTKDTNEAEVVTFTNCKVDGADFAG